MTQLLDTHERASELDRPQGMDAPASAMSASSAQKRFRNFAITFGIAFAILYTVFERLNWPLFTYHPAVGKIDFWMQPARSGEGPPMYWYGWIALSSLSALLLAWIATVVSDRALQRATIFGCAFAIFWSGALGIGIYLDERTSFDPDLVRRLAWMTAIPGILAAAAVGYFVPLQWAQRVWRSWLLVMPIGGLAILGYSLKQYFLR
jgi:hypothetical protein